MPLPPSLHRKTSSNLTVTDSPAYKLIVKTRRNLMSMKLTMSSAGMPSIPSSITPPPPATLPVRKIPGGHGWPLFGSIADRLDYFWFQGPEKFFRARMEKNQSTVFRTNVPPSSPFFSTDPKVIAVLDCESFAHLFDMEIVEKKNILVGDFMPSTSFTGNMRVCAYLDTSESQHSKVKNFVLDILRRSSKIWIPELESNLSTLWGGIESEIAKNSKPSSYRISLQQALFSFFSKTLAGADPAKSPEIAKSGYLDVIIWLGLQLGPTIHLGILQPLEEIFLHSFRLPFFPIAGRYQRLYDFIEKQGEEVVRRGVSEFGLKKEEAIHNLIFTLGFNAYGGFSIFLPVLLDQILNDKTGLQQRIVEEVRAKSGTAGLTFDSVKEMKLVYSVVYETLRLNPPVPTQYARARKDFKLRSHDSVFEVKKGELLCGYQPLVMRDPKVFNEPEEFKAERFREEEGLLDYLFWSNGPQTGTPSKENKQCAAKDLVVLTGVVFVAYMFRRYDSVAGEGGSITALSTS